MHKNPQNNKRASTDVEAPWKTMSMTYRQAMLAPNRM